MKSKLCWWITSKRILFLHLSVAMLISSVLLQVPICMAENQELKRECEAKARKASNLIIEIGAEAAFEQITDPKGDFVTKTSHVFCIEADTGSLLAHKVAKFVGSNMHYYMDFDGNHPYTGILERAGQSDNGWTRYMTYGSGPERRTTPALKNMYFLKVPGKTIVLCCGYWEPDA